MPRTKGYLNKHQRQAFKLGEKRTRGEEIWHYVELSKSKDPKDRLQAAENLCPCHVRRRIDEVWEALYKMLEDPVRDVRKAAYHTLEDGGRPDDPALTEIFERALESETDEKIRRRVVRFLGSGKEDEEMAFIRRSASPYPDRGRCDFCGEDGAVRTDFDTEIPGEVGTRAALVCESCDS